VFAGRAGALTVRQLINSYLDKHVRPNLRSASAIERRFTKNVIPVIGSLLLSELHKREVSRVVDSILARGRPVEATRCFEDLRALFRWGVGRGDLDHNPMEGMRKPGQARARERVLSDTEIAILWNHLSEVLPRSPQCQRIIELCLLTAQRVGEVSGICRDELDLSARTWTIPGARTKNKHAHVVPLSDLAFDIIADVLPDKGGTQFLFPNDKGEGPLPGHAVAKRIRLAQERFGIRQWSAHDLRRTAVTCMAELGVSPIVLGHVINHRSVTKAGVTLSVYSHYDYAKEKREALALWADRLAGIVAGGAKVLPMVRGA
jgi:integrase